ncbi:DnaJ family domain-containing protein [Virgibacillus soli]|uniref:DUF1992 domain-containing protein n=1 Tax=Paracerasibacillus soli TaxID=480284 RepID=A0ABU5CMJ9_9BACI|nr:DnaJ family domain-containing protein [Virgibacillus soli]MDY0407597.1 DUF1992 domain-containing protein [Virgibacillus soli]
MREKNSEREDDSEISASLQYTDHMTAIIRQAEADGHFTDLPGKGKPLNLGREYMNPSEAQLYKTMKDNHVLPRWVEVGKEIEQLINDLEGLEGKEMQRKLKQINKKIKEYNGICPPMLQKNKIHR